MAQQLLIDYEASEFEGFERTQEFFAYMSRTLRNEKGVIVAQKYQAADMEMSPAQFSQKLNESNNTSITLNDADRHTEIFGDTRWIEYAFWKHVVKRKKNRQKLLELKAQIERELEAAA